MLIFILIFYFMLIRPQSKQRQAINNMINNLKIGDKIITKGGIIAQISQIKEETLIIEVEAGTKIEILKHAVVSLINDDQK
ncbi:preprotein translocase subunit YajC [Candidatus Dependentiae bacterium]|nr:preprotein translocase subunit YajC [Candidatus Dependentiae bacterium]MBU4386869.1 preprotein translocase subunit YajC [Candidatus Dependentiae bacterium]